MDKAYWLKRKSASLTLAQNAGSSEGRLAQYDLAGRYSVKAASAHADASGLAKPLPLAMYTHETGTHSTEVADD